MSNDRIATYIRSTLLPSGFSIIDADIAFKLSCGLWSSPTNIASDFADKQVIINRFGAGCHVLRTEIEGREVLVLARSMKGLKGRVEAVTGLVVDAIAPHVVEEVQPVPVPKVVEPNTAKIQRELRKDYTKQVAEHADFERRRQALSEGEKHRKWLEQRRVDAEASRQAHFEKKRGGHGG